ncbi:MAG: aldo/keto reductase [Gammaproteobacteria bacterium]|nr:aldo/keto reductase [Gammaproteobacteria bacterium]
MTHRNTHRISRRHLVQAASLLGAGVLLPRFAWGASGAAQPLITRRIPSTGEILPVMGIGTNRFGNLKDVDAQGLLHRMAELGGAVIDTAAMYGESEAVIGRSLAALNLRSKMFVATKFNAPGATFGPPPRGMPASPPPGAPAGRPPMMQEQVYGMESFERSLKRLQTERVDLLMAHFIGSVEPLMPTMLELKKAGRTRYIGITSIRPDQHPQLIEYMRKYPIDFVQVDYSLGSRSSASDVFPVALERKIAVMVAVPFGGGRNSLFRQIGDRALPPWAAELGAASWSQLFLKYVIAHPAVTCVIPGSTDLNHLEDNQAAGHGSVLRVEQQRRIEAFWDQKA